jgi:hypothetical protein
MLVLCCGAVALQAAQLLWLALGGCNSTTLSARIAGLAADGALMLCWRIACKNEATGTAAAPW